MRLLVICLLTATLSVLSGCSPPDSAGGANGNGAGPGSAVPEYSDATLNSFAEQLLAGDFEAAHAHLSEGLQAQMDQNALEQLWNESVADLGSDLTIIEADIGALPDTPGEYGFETAVARSDWVNWSFVTIGNEYAIDLRGLTVKQDGKTVIEHFEFGLAD